MGANIVLTFNENVAAGSGSITLKKSSDNSTVQAMAVGGANVSISGTTVTINPTADLDSSQGYYLQIAATAIDDTSGNTLASMMLLHLTLSRLIMSVQRLPLPLQLIMLRVWSSANVVLTFSENVQVGSGNITIFKSDNTQVEAIDVTSGR